MSASINRRTFMRVAATGAGLGVLSQSSVASGVRAPSDMVRVGIMGVNGRGNALAQSFARIAGSEVTYICDVDSRAVTKTIAAVSESRNGSSLQQRRPTGVTDVRRVLDDPDVDALVIAAPDHWHAPATIMALQAGKHVYVEKPCSHNAREGELLVEAQRKYDRVVQMGNQQRSAPPFD